MSRRPQPRTLPSLAAFLVALLALCGTFSPLAATSYVMMADTDLADQAQRGGAVIEARVMAVQEAPADGRPFTEYTVAVEKTLIGSVRGTTLTVRVPGGMRADGIGLRIHGVPEFAVGDRPLLFLQEQKDGSYGILHLMLGAFHRFDLEGQPLAVRNMAETREVELPGRNGDPRLHQPRDFGLFSRWLEDRGRGIQREPDYFQPVDSSGISRIIQRFTLITARGTTLNVRHFEFDAGQSIPWSMHSGGQPGVPGGGFSEFRRALNAWTGDTGSKVLLAAQGNIGNSNGFLSFDGINVLLPNDPNQEISGTFTCPGGGILAIGGPWFSSGDRAVFNGVTYVIGLGGDVVMNDGIECYLAGADCPGLRAEEVYGHELGHTLGLGHSCGDASSPACDTLERNQALMRAFAHGDCRGAALGPDDRSGMRALYPETSGGGGGGSGKPATPTDFVATRTGLAVTLTWRDRSNNETGFKVLRKAGSAAEATLATLPAGSTSYTDLAVAPGVTYVYRVASSNSQGDSPSSPVTVAVPAPTPVSVAIAPVVGAVSTGGVVDLRATFSGPVVSAEWDFGGNNEVGFSDEPCLPSTLCRGHIFTSAGSRVVRVTVSGDLGQSATSTINVTVANSGQTLSETTAFVQSVILGARGESGTFQSDLWLHNAGGATAAEVRFLPRGAAPTPVPPRRLTLTANESVYLPNVLGTLLAASGQGSLTVTTLRPTATVAGATSEPPLFAISRSFAVPEDPLLGTFGQFVPSHPEAEWTATEKIATGIQEGGGWVSTLLAANVDGFSGQVQVRLFDAAGAEVGSVRTFDLGPNTIRFQPINQLFPGVASRTGPFTARFTSTGIKFLASSTLLEDGSEDQIFIPASEPLVGNEFYLPRIVKGPGRFDVTLTSQIAVLNNAGVPTNLTFQFLERGQNNSSPREAQRTVPAGGLLFLDDAVTQLFDLTTGTGAVKVIWSNTQGIAPRVVSLGIARNPANKRFGMLVDSRTAAEGTTTRAIDFGAEQTVAVQASYGALNLGANNTTMQITLLDSDGTVIATNTRNLLPFQHVELGLLQLFPGFAGGVNLAVRTEVQGGGGPVLTYLVNIDASGDIFYVPGEPLGN